MRQARMGLGAMIGALALGTTALATTAMAEPRYTDEGRAPFLRFLDTPGADEPMRRPPTLHLSFGGQDYRAVMDTGSTGVVVSASLIPNVDRLPVVAPGQLTYTSSGRIMRGDWVVTPLTISGAGGTSITTRPMPVLAVRQIDCFENARDCQATDDPRHVVMLGIGFAREGDRQSQSTPDKNPFLSLPDMGEMNKPGRLRRGYVVTREGVHVGLTRANTGGEFRFVKLARADDGSDWTAIPGCMSVGGGEPACGTALIDTGVSDMYLTVPPDREAGFVTQGDHGRTLVPGTKVSVTFSARPSNDAPGYLFTAGMGSDPLAPSRIILVGGKDRPPFVNTSVHILNGFDYLYDADEGYAGFRRLGR
ncbi:pepsin/retropepsin-like aspartic protease family protein [Chelatococcus asaccharovorans]|uniref:hypothetical protein n=1 Tax=Chelatococcus asaccharovorans TaxID=28210 RepID=UPI002264982A|nr:hypothetical protein [Chelatococcus asaccharovorans]